MFSKIKNSVVLVVILLSSFSLEKAHSKESSRAPLEQKALDYYSSFESVVVCNVTNIFSLRKEVNKPVMGHRDDIEVYYTFIVIAKVDKPLKGKVPVGTLVACYVCSSNEKLQMKGSYYLGFDGDISKVFITENDNFCPVLDMQKRNR